MSCWVVPTVAAEYWGVSLDVVWRRLYEGLVPHKSDEGFVFIDVDPWSADSDGSFLHDPPQTFVAAGEESTAFDFSEHDLQEPLSYAPSEWQPALEPAQFASEEAGGEEETAVLEAEAELPELDEQETATFGRLSWLDVRSKVSRSRRPPSSRA
jgi:hypothetical protein